jgi:hypothetical protein
VYGGEPPLAAMVQPAYPVPWVPPGQVVVTIARGPPEGIEDVTVTLAVAVLEPAASVAFNV